MQMLGQLLMRLGLLFSCLARCDWQRLGLGSNFGSGAIGARVALAALPFCLPVDFFSVFAGALGKCFAVGLLGMAALPCPTDAGLTGAAEAWGSC